MRRVMLETIGLSVVSACVLSLGLMSPGVVGAGQVKKDVCHLEGTGDYHVINIAEPAWQTHYDHGDGDADGGEVPGMEGYVFDAECNVVSACPCDFSLEAYLALDVDPENECYIDEPGAGTAVGGVFDEDFSIQLDDEGCFTVDNGELTDIHEYTNPEEQTDACRSAILAIAAALSIPQCQ